MNDEHAQALGGSQGALGGPARRTPVAVGRSPGGREATPTGARDLRPAATRGALGASSMDEADRALTRALVAGDGEAFRMLVERETSRVFRTCYRVLGRIEDAEDVTQETFVLAYRSLGTFRGDGHPAAWLTRIASREAWRRVAQRSRRRSLTTTLDEGELRVESEGSDPASLAIVSEERERVRVAVERLPEPYREIITLRFFAELSLLEICAATGRPEGTVKAQVHRGLKRLHESLMGDAT